MTKRGVTPYNPGQTGGFENAAGSGEIHYYRLFDGVGIMLLRLEMETYTEIRTQIGMIEINFCINGRFETSFSMRDSVLLKPGGYGRQLLRRTAWNTFRVTVPAGLLRRAVSGS